MVTVCAELYGPAAGLKVGVATVEGPALMVYVAEAIALSVMPPAYAMALMVVVLATVIGLVYNVPAVSLGVLPLVVYRMEAPVVVVLMVTIWVELYVPAAGLNVGVATLLPGG